MTGPNFFDFIFNYSYLFAHDTYKAVEKLHAVYGKDEKPINVYIPGIQNIVIIYDPEDISSLSKEEKKGNLKKGYTIDFVKKYLLGEGFAALEQGESYKTLHKHMVPFFSKRKINGNYNTIREKIHELSEKKILTHPDGAIIDLQETLKSLSMSIILKTMMNFDIRFEEGIEINKRIDFILDYISYRQLHSPFNIPDWLPTAHNQSYQESKTFLDNLCYMILNHCEQNEHDDSFVRHLVKNNIAKEIIKDQILNILFGGYETTSHWMSMSIYRLALHSKSRNDLIKEIVKNPSAQSANDLRIQNFPNIYSFSQEVLRLHSPIQIYGRDAINSITLRNQFVIPKGSLVVSAQYLSHRYDRSWTDPEEFNYKRFHPEYKDRFKKEQNRHVRSFYPFGYGQRSCVGRFLADLEVRTLVYEYLKQTKFSFEAIESDPPETEIICTARLKNGLKMKLVKNENLYN